MPALLLLLLTVALRNDTKELTTKTKGRGNKKIEGINKNWGWKNRGFLTQIVKKICT